MSIVVVGSVALDSVETPSGKVENALGGSATYFSVSASFFTNDIGLVAIVLKDFPKENIDFLKSRGIDLEGLEIAEGKTFHWSGRYGMSLSGAETLSTELNVFEKFSPKIPEKYKELMGLVGSIVLRCDDCILYHLIRCFEEEVTDDEIVEAVDIALIIGGSITIPHIRRLFDNWKGMKEKD
jgi:AhpD family alkylhydroperoxidase